MGAHSFDDLAQHAGHEIECVFYAHDANVAVECLTCSAVLLDFDRAPEPAPEPFRVEIHGELGDDDGEIVLFEGARELVMWESREWQDEPSLLFVIANAIVIGYTEGAAGIRARLGRDELVEGALDVAGDPAPKSRLASELQDDTAQACERCGRPFIEHDEVDHSCPTD